MDKDDRAGTDLAAAAAMAASHHRRRIQQFEGYRPTTTAPFNHSIFLKTFRHCQ